MKKLTLTLLFIFTFAFFTGQTNVNADSIAKAKPTTFSDVTEDTETFSVVEALEPYIKIAPPSVQVYYYTKIYCEEFDVPETVAFGVVKLETAYKGPDKHDYNPSQTSSANARGPYQLLLSTAKDMYVILGLGPRHELTSEMLLTDVELNVKLGIRYLKWVHDNVSRNWTIVCGFYNSGYPIVNGYAMVATKYI